MEENIFIFLNKNNDDYTLFNDKYLFDDNNSTIATFTIDSCEYCYRLEKSKTTLILYRVSENTPFNYLGSKTSERIENAQKIIRVVKGKINTQKTKFIFIVHWGGKEAKDKQLHLELNSELNKKNNKEFRFASFTGEYYNTYDTIDNLKKFLFSQTAEATTNVYDAQTLKKDIINLWLPLAIDIQGLSEVQNDTTKASNYFDEVKKETDYLESLKSFPNDDKFPRWEEIKNELNKGYKDFNPVELVNDLKKANSFDSFRRSDRKYLEKGAEHNPEPNFLPNWLQEVVSILDKKINAQNSKD